MGAQPSSPTGRSSVRGRGTLQHIDGPSGITVEVPSSPGGRGLGFGPGSPGSSKAAPFAPTSDPAEAWLSNLQGPDGPLRRCTPPRVRPSSQALGSSSPKSFNGDLEAGSTEQEAGAADVEVIRIDSKPTRRPSKMSVESFETVQDSLPLASDSRPSSSRDHAFSRPSSVGGSRPASASSKVGGPRGPSLKEFRAPAKDPTLAHAERLAKASLEKLQQQEFITGRSAWGASTPSTASQPSLSRAASSQSSSTCGSRPASSAASVTSSCYSMTSSQGKNPDVKQQLKEAQQRAKASLKALQSELKGSASATPARYSTWPVGCTLRIATDDPADVMGDIPSSASLLACLVNYNSSDNTFEVKLDDGSSRIVPAQRVTRARARDRASAPVESKDQGIGSMVSTDGRLGSSGYQVATPHSERTRMQRHMSEQPPLAENSPWSPMEPEPQLFGRMQAFA